MAGMGPLAQRIYETLLERVSEASPGTRLPTLVDLVAEFDVAPMTIRQVLARLEEEAYIVREQGRGTFVRERIVPAVLIVDDEAAQRKLVAHHVSRLGHRALEAAGPAAGLAALAGEPGIALVLSDVRMPEREDGIGFIRAARQGWPDIPLAAITGYPDDLAPLRGTPHCPVLILQKPVWAHDIEEVLRLALPVQAGKPLTTAVAPAPRARRAAASSPSAAEKTSPTVARVC
jgi:CheY-like chemotaxis protein